MSAKKRQKTKKEPQKKSVPDFVAAHWNVLVIVVLLVIPLIYFAPFLNANKMIAGSDYLLGGHPVEEWISEQEGLPLWYPHVFGGMPVLGTPAGGPLAPFAQLRQIMPPHIVMTISFIIAFFAAGIGMYLYLKEIGLSGYAAAVGAVVYQFIGSIATTPYAGHMARALSAALFPMMLFLVHRGLRSKRLLYFVLLSVVTALAFYDGHFQITYYALIFLVIYGIHYLVVHRRDYSRKQVIKVVGYGFCSVVLIVTLMAAVWLPVYGGLGAGARGVERGYEYATSWAMPPLEIVDLVVPTFSGILEKYWGFNHFKIHFEYFGVLAIVLALFALIFYRKKSYVKLYALVALIVPFIAFGGATPVFRIFYTIIPGFRLLRAHSMIFYMVSFSIIVLGSISFHNIFTCELAARDKRNFKRRFMIVAGIMLAVVLLVGIIGVVGRESVIQSMQGALRSKFIAEYGEQGATAKLGALANNYSDLVGGVWRSIVFLVLVLGLIYLSIVRKLKPWLFAIAAVAIALVDQVPLAIQFLPSAPGPDAYYAEDDVVRFLKRDRTVFRVLPFQSQPPLNARFLYHPQDSYLFYHDIQSAGGYVTSPIQRYQEFIGAGTSVMFNPANLFFYPKFVDMLNLKYIITPNLPDDLSQYDAQSRMIIQNIKTYLARYRRVFQAYQFSVYQNDSVLPRAYIVPGYRVVDEAQSLDVLQSEAFDPRTTVTLEKDPGTPVQIYQDTLIEPEIREYTANRIVCHAECPFPGFLVLADNWHPDWKVFVDGEEKKLYQANHTFRAVRITAGKHDVVFAYISIYFNVGRIISIIALLLSVGFCILTIRVKI